MNRANKLDIFNIKYLMLIKPIIDMLWNISLLNYFIMLYAIVILVIEYRDSKIRVKNIDLFIIIALWLIAISFVHEMNSTTVRALLKLVSPFILYYIGRNTKEDPSVLMHYMCNGYILAFLIDIIALILGKGFVYWGHALTFTGFYFFKTDIGVALLWLMFLIVFNEIWFCKRKIRALIMLSISFVMIILTNSRMTLILTLFLAVISFLYYREKNTGHPIKVRLRLILLGICALIIGICLIRFLGNTAFFVNNGFIAFNFEKLSDLYSAGNLQGRDAIWNYLMEKFNSECFFKKMFGVSLNSYISGDTYLSGLSSHNIYIGILYSFGYFGSMLFVIYIGVLIRKLNSEKNRILFYATLFSMSLLLIYGISVNTHEFTNYTWNFGLLTGLLYNNYFKNQSERLEYYEKKCN